MEYTENDIFKMRAIYEVRKGHTDLLFDLLTREGSEIAESELVELTRYGSAHLSIDYSNAHMLLESDEDQGDGITRTCYVVFLNRLCARDAMLSVDIVNRYTGEDCARDAIAHYRSAVFHTDLQGKLD